MKTSKNIGTLMLASASRVARKRKAESDKKAAVQAKLGIHGLMKIFSAQTEALNKLGVDVIDQAKVLSKNPGEIHESDDLLDVHGKKFPAERLNIKRIACNGKLALIFTYFQLDQSGERASYLPVRQEYKVVPAESDLQYKITTHLLKIFLRRAEQRMKFGFYGDSIDSLESRAKKSAKKVQAAKKGCQLEIDLFEQEQVKTTLQDQVLHNQSITATAAAM